MPKSLQIVELGNPILRMRAKDVEDVKDHAIQVLIGQMIRTCQSANGVGIAAPQVSQLLRLFIMASSPNLRYPDAPKMVPTAIINPIVITYSEQMEGGWEGCLSIPGIRGIVPRSRSVKVMYTNSRGEDVLKTLDGFLARIFQHEYDHLNGILFLDRAESRSLATESEYQKIFALK